MLTLVSFGIYGAGGGFFGGDGSGTVENLEVCLDERCVAHCTNWCWAKCGEGSCLATGAIVLNKVHLVGEVREHRDPL